MDDAFAKLKRANEHMQSLRKILPTQSFALPTRTEYRPDEKMVVWVVDESADLSPQIPLILGDFVQNLRAGLDHAWWTLASRKLHRTPTEDEAPSIQFIIRKPGGGFDHGTNVRWVGGRAAAIARNAQPPATWDPATTETEVHPLGALRYLSNVDKHRQLHVTFNTMESVDVRAPVEWSLTDCHLDPEHVAAGTQAYTPPVDPRLEVGSVLLGLRVVTTGPAPDAVLPFTAMATVGIEPGWKLRPLVGAMFDKVARIVADFADLP